MVHCRASYVLAGAAFARSIARLTAGVLDGHPPPLRRCQIQAAMAIDRTLTDLDLCLGLGLDQDRSHRPVRLSRQKKGHAGTAIDQGPIHRDLDLDLRRAEADRVLEEEAGDMEIMTAATDGEGARVVTTMTAMTTAVAVGAAAGTTAVGKHPGRLLTSHGWPGSVRLRDDGVGARAT